MKKEEQEAQKKSNIWIKLSKWVEGMSFQAKIFIISFIILLLGFIFIKNSNDKDILKSLEKSRRETEDKLRAISLYDGRLDGYQESISTLDEQIKDTNIKIQEIIAEKPKNTTLDEFFDKRI